MRDNRAADTRDVAAQEAHARLLQGVVRLLGLAELLVDLLDRLLERRELDHLHDTTLASAFPPVFILHLRKIREEDQNKLTVYGICLPQSGTNPLYSPASPSFATTLLTPSRMFAAYGGSVVCMRTLTASHGHSAMSARNSALALAPRYTIVLFAFGNHFSPYMYLKTS